MAHHEDISHLSPEEKLFHEYKRNADDFFKIEIFRYARNYYRKALEIKKDNPEIQEKIEACSAQLRFETRIAFILIGITLAVIAVARIL